MSNITGDISNAPRFGKKALILLRKGSVIRYVKSKTEYTNLFPVLIILKATNQLNITFAITMYE